MSKNKKIICFIDSFNSGGAQKQMAMLANGLSKNNQVTTLQYHDLNFFSRLLENNISQKKILTRNRLMRIIKILLYFNKKNPEVIISFLHGPNNYAALYKMIFFWRRVTLVVGERNLNHKGLKLKDLIIRFSHLFATFIVCNSNAQKLVLSKYFKRKLYFIPNGTDFKFNNQTSEAKKTKSKQVKLVVAARFIKQKNPLGLIKAIEKMDNVSVYWYGELFKHLPTYDQAIEYIKKNGVNNFYFMGSSKNIYAEFEKYDAMILPSYYEGCPNAIIDGMLCKMPILASDVSDNKLYLEHQDYLLFDPFNPKDISSKIKVFLSLDNDALNTISKQNFKHAKKHFDHKTMINNYLKLIE